MTVWSTVATNMMLEKPHCTLHGMEVGLIHTAKFGVHAVSPLPGQKLEEIHQCKIGSGTRYSTVCC